MPADFRRSVDRFLRKISGESPETLFNPWRQVDRELDLADAAAIRRGNLRQYLLAHENAEAVLVGEAAGWAGCRFTGIPFTGENLIQGPECLDWAKGRPMKRSSKADKPYKERSATIVWGEIAGDPRLVLWNAVPWHPFKPGSPLSNRKPRREEERIGEEILKLFIDLFPAASVHAIGRVSQQTLANLGIEAGYIRHPSMGGQKKFCTGMRALRKNLDRSLTT
ncbi:MAG: hypothetical protein CBC13_09015 [Planctomycetia bacterium TMED53]|nr:MAG: hypothetical protein CBC13_09015 [Planctomycetia bacterium TMED53]